MKKFIALVGIPWALIMTLGIFAADNYQTPQLLRRGIVPDGGTSFTYASGNTCTDGTSTTTVVNPDCMADYFAYANPVPSQTDHTGKSLRTNGITLEFFNGLANPGDGYTTRLAIASLNSASSAINNQGMAVQGSHAGAPTIGSANPTATTMGTYRLTSPATLNSHISLTTYYYVTHTGKESYSDARVAISPYSNVQFRLGHLGNTALGALQASNNCGAVQCATFVALAGTNTNFQCILGNGSAETSADSGVAVDTNQHRFEIKNVSGVWSFYIDGTQVCGAMAQTNAPSNTGLTWMVSLNPNAAEAKVLDFSYVFIRDKSI